MARLSLTIQRDLQGGSIETGGALADILPVEAEGSEEHLNVLVPVNSTAPAVIDVSPGDYIVQVRFPSGQTETRRVRLSSENASEDLEFRPTESPREWLSWQSYLGTAPVSIPKKVPRRRTVDTTPPPSSPEDDLTRIRGVGPKLEEALRTRGISRIEQVARLSERELDWLNDSAGTFRSTISKFDIAQAAKELISDEEALPAGVAPVPFGVEAPPVGGEDELVELPSAGDITMAWFERPEGTRSGPAFWPALDDLLRANPPPDTPPLDLANRLTSSVVFTEPSGQGYFVDADAGLSAITLWGSTKLLQHPLAKLLQHPLANRNGPNPEAPFDRVYTVIDDGFVKWLAPLPAPWSTEGKWADLMITADRTNLFETTVNIMPGAGNTAGLLGYLQAGDIRATSAILEKAKDRLFEKIENPFAAAAGGLILVQAVRWSRERTERTDRLLDDTRWNEWISNLRAWNPWLPDGLVLHGWLELLQSPPGTVGGAREKLLAATRGGLPVYSGVFRLLVDGLRLLEAQSETLGSIDSDVTKALRMLDRASLRIDMRQAFTILRLTPRPRPEAFGL